MHANRLENSPAVQRITRRTRNALAAATAAGAMLLSASATADWVSVPTVTPTPRSGIIAEAVNGIVYVGQGASPGGSSNGQFDAYNPATNTWQSLPKVGDLYSRTSGTTGGKIYAFGGVEHGGPLATSNVFDPVAGNWSALPNMPTPRSAAAAAEWGGQFYVMGGSPVFGSNPGTTAIERFDPASNSWTSLASMPASRYSEMAAAVDGKIYSFGGSQPGILFDTVDVYDIATNTWTSRASMPVPLAAASVEVYNGKILFVGGANQTSAFADFRMYDPLADSWQLLDPMLTPRVALGTAIVGDMLYAFAGESNGYLSSVESFDLRQISSSVPEPGSLALVLAGLAAMSFARRRSLPIKSTIARPLPL